jgi:hypothetical protein
VLSQDSSIGGLLLSALAVFLNTIGSSGALEAHSRPTRLAAAIQQQLQQAGLYQHLSPILTSLTAQFAAAEPST